MNGHFPLRLAGVLLVDAAVIVVIEIDAPVVERRNVVEIFNERVLRHLIRSQLFARDPGLVRADDVPRIFGVDQVAQRQLALAFADRIQRGTSLKHQLVGRRRQPAARERDDPSVEILADPDDVLNIAVRRIEQRGNSCELRSEIAQSRLDLLREDRGIVAIEPLVHQPLQGDVEVEQLHLDGRPAVGTQIALHREYAVGDRKGRKNRGAGFVEIVVGVEVRRDDEKQLLHDNRRPSSLLWRVASYNRPAPLRPR